MPSVWRSKDNSALHGVKEIIKVAHLEILLCLLQLLAHLLNLLSAVDGRQALLQLLLLLLDHLLQVQLLLYEARRERLVGGNDLIGTIKLI